MEARADHHPVGIAGTETLNRVLHLAGGGRKMAVAQFQGLYPDRAKLSGGQQPCAGIGLSPPPLIACQNQEVHGESCMLREHSPDRARGTELDVVRVGPDRERSKRAFSAAE